MESFSALQRAENSSMPTASRTATPGSCFSALQRAENSSIGVQIVPPDPRYHVSVLFSEPKIPQCERQHAVNTHVNPVSVLFSEPKIPQWTATLGPSVDCTRCFSALQRAENSSISSSHPTILLKKSSSQVSVLFSEPKIPQCEDTSKFTIIEITFQCSSASRKFLNRCRFRFRNVPAPSFSALQRAENSSISERSAAMRCSIGFSALQRAENSSMCVVYCARSRLREVSVLFSEPKIPQYRDAGFVGRLHPLFQCSSASRKFLN